jgi:hypothetical protein
MEEVTGSIPVRSTKTPSCKIQYQEKASKYLASPFLLSIEEFDARGPWQWE